MNLVCANENTPISNISSENFTQKADKWWGIFKKVFLFLPGMLILHIACFTAISFHEQLGLTVFMLFWLASGIFMVWAGLGNLKNIKHLLIPLSFILSVMFVSVLVGLLPEAMQPKTFEYSIYLLPAFFAIPILVKGLINKLEEGKTEFDIGEKIV